MKNQKKPKIVIIGGGIAGISCASLLYKGGYEVMVSERDSNIPIRGNAFLMHSEGFNLLKNLVDRNQIIDIPGKTIDTFILNRPDETELKHMKMEPWQCIKRKDVVQFLYSLIPPSIIRTNRVFSHFIYKNEAAVAAVFKNGDVEYGDIFIGADGAHSGVRQALFGKTIFSPVEVREVVGIASITELIKQHPNIFKKYQSGENGLSFGFIPASNDELVWFMQYDVSAYTLPNEQPESLRNMCEQLLSDFPPVVKHILDNSDFSGAYLWNATDFDSLATFHKNNVVLIGDAAHLALPFTSAGTTNALVDANTLVRYLMASDTMETAFRKYYYERIFKVSEHLELGRELKRKFLSRNQEDADDIKIPLISHQEINKKTAPKFKKVHLLYFTDPVCSTCWTIQPHIRKLKIEYADYLEVEYCMGGLLPSWSNYNRGSIKTPQDAFNYWKLLSGNFSMPVNPDVWKNDPLPSSYPPSIAFKAAQMQDMDKAIIFLRKLTELLFIHGVNIVNEELMMKEAYEAGLDVARMKRDIRHKAAALFNEDIKLAKELSIEVLPTFIFTDRFDRSLIMKGYQEYSAFENVMGEFLGDIKKKRMNRKYNKVFVKFPTLTSNEFAFLFDLDTLEARQQLEELAQKKIIQKEEIMNAEVIWKLNPELNSRFKA